MATRQRTHERVLDAAHPSVVRASTLTKAYEKAAKQFAGEPFPVTIEAIEGYLRATAKIDQPPHERLRQLAIRLEGGTEWSSIRAIYDAAIEFAPHEVSLHHSLGLSARRYLDGNPGAVVRNELMVEARKALDMALSCDPECADAVFTRALLEFRHGPSIPAALVWFEWAAEMRPSDPLYQVFVGHAHHAMGDFSAAVKAYQKVHLRALEQDRRPWRAVEVRLRLAESFIKLGDKARGRSQASELIEELATWSGLEGAGNRLDELLELTRTALPELETAAADILRRANNEPKS